MARHWIKASGQGGFALLLCCHGVQERRSWKTSDTLDAKSDLYFFHFETTLL